MPRHRITMELATPGEGGDALMYHQLEEILWKWLPTMFARTPHPSLAMSKIDTLEVEDIP